MDATRSRRTHDQVRCRWYAHWRTLRFADHMGFGTCQTWITPKPGDGTALECGMGVDGVRWFRRTHSAGR